MRLLKVALLLPGRTTLGHGAVDINIQGPGVAVQHCYIENKSGVITLNPCGNLCAIDGLQVSQPVRLSQGRTQPEHTTHSWVLSVHHFLNIEIHYFNTNMYTTYQSNVDNINSS